jgi:hypothetical protein
MEITYKHSRNINIKVTTRPKRSQHLFRQAPSLNAINIRSKEASRGFRMWSPETGIEQCHVWGLNCELPPERQ